MTPVLFVTPETLLMPSRFVFFVSLLETARSSAEIAPPESERVFHIFQHFGRGDFAQTLRHLLFALQNLRHFALVAAFHRRFQIDLQFVIVGLFDESYDFAIALRQFDIVIGIARQNVRFGARAGIGSCSTRRFDTTNRGFWRQPARSSRHPTDTLAADRFE